DNKADTVGHPNVIITPTQITSLANASINYTGTWLASLTINGGHGVNIYHVLGTPSAFIGEEGVPVTLNLAPIDSTSTVVPGGQDTIDVGSPTGTLDSIRGKLMINGQFGTADILNINDQ